MGLLWNSRKKPQDPFQAAVKQYRRQDVSARPRGGQSDSSHSSGSHLSPYREPGLGFYSGENLATSQSQQQELDGSAERETQWPDLVDQDMALPMAKSYPETVYWNTDSYYHYSTAADPWMGPPSWLTKPQDLPYHHDLDQQIYHHHPAAMDPYPPDETMRLPSDVRYHHPDTRSPAFPPDFRPAPPFIHPTTLLPSQHQPAWPPHSQYHQRSWAPPPQPLFRPELAAEDTTSSNNNNNIDIDRPPPRPPGSYERLRPPHLPGNGSGSSRR